ncbi:chemotaxis protein CheW [Desulfovibrio sulfodismutans]|uniref:Chemotaxis protein CheW n=1 Tax=Desulfolutivibrio sulfodismutans TaxID=63561 RepID=A0A7K3NLL2_9BACT|nr:chemotaxis protein CheW [Desulfolutivibrio sulfodismutans]NDY57086.1 chemotaxis protein CheW [Desulfolutivibrio sulfodismutans]QLA11715.1 chemotaxis protein CheW [Desulfolutivibrio sulfodismutans DSM 3696]
MAAEDTTLNDNQYLTFVLENELFALNIGSVREVLELTSITKVPRTPEFIRGVINLRGRAVPVVDLRMKFGMGETRRTVNTCIIIVEVELDGESTVLGALADSVQEVYEMESSQIEPPPRMGTRIKAEFITGMGKSGDRFIVILDINKVFSAEELTLAADAGRGQPLAEGREVAVDAGA